MVQFYCLSVVVNIFVGLILVYGTKLSKKNAVESLEDDSQELVEQTEVAEEKSKVPAEKNNNKESFGLGNRNLRFFIGIVSVIVGFVKLFSAYRGIPILGDLLPAAAGMVGGLSVLLEYYSATASDKEFELQDKFRILFVDSRKYIGVLCLLSALLHFAVPNFIIL